MNPNKIIDMNDIEEALNCDDYCEGMEKIGFSVLYFDEDSETDCYFIDDNRKWIVHFDFANQEFWTYSKANHRRFANPAEGEQE